MVFCGGGGGLVIGGGTLLVGGGSFCDDLGGVSTGDEVMLTSPPELAHCGGGGPKSRRFNNLGKKLDPHFS